MSRRQIAARVLLSLYPAVWRREYGPELIDILGARPITFGVVVDVTWSGICLRARASQPSTILGLTTLMLIVGSFVLMPPTAGRQWTALLQPVASTFLPALSVFVAAEIYTLCMVACGCWTYLRNGASFRRCGLAAMRMSLIAGLPVMVCALLMLLGLVDVTFLASQRVRPLPWLMLLSPLLRLPEAWIWGAVGGMLGWWLRKTQPSASPLSQEGGSARAE